MLRKTSLLRIGDDVSLVLDEHGNDAVAVRGTVGPLTASDSLALQLFAIRRSLECGVRALARQLGDNEPAAALALVVGMVERGLLIEDRQSVPRRSRARGMFGCPLAEFSDVKSGDIVVYGMPYELGLTGRLGAKHGPDYLRRASAAAFDYGHEGRPIGWWYPHCHRRVLTDVSIRDIGDIDCNGSVRNGEAFDRLYKVHHRVLKLGGFPLLLGGDHSISLPAITATADVHPGLGVIHLDAHSDLGSQREMGDWRRHASHGNFMSWVASNERVSRIVQLGIRHLLPAGPPYVDAKVEVHVGIDWLNHLGSIFAGLPKDCPYYLSFDVDCLDPAVIGQTGTPIPGGLSYHDAAMALRTLATGLELVAMDIVELSAGPSLLEGTTVSYLAFEVLAQQFLRRDSLSKAQDPVGAR